MIDTSLLSKRHLPLPDPKSELSGDDDSLFVSEDDNDVQPSSTLTNGNVLDTPAFVGTADSASSFRNEIEESAQPPSHGPSVFQANGTTAPSPGPSFPQTSEPPKTFSSLFNTGATNSANPFATPTAAAPNPFTAFSNPFGTKKTEEPPHKGAGIFPTAPAPQQSAPAFPAPNIFPSADRMDGTAAQKPPSTAPQFKLPGFSQMAPSPAPAFSAPTTAESNENAGLVTSQPPASIFDSVKPSPFSFNTPPAFSFPSQSTASKETGMKTSSAGQAPAFSFPARTAPSDTDAKERPMEPAKPTQETPSPFFPSSSTPPALFRPKQNGKTIFQCNFHCCADHVQRCIVHFSVYYACGNFSRFDFWGYEGLGSVNT